MANQPCRKAQDHPLTHLSASHELLEALKKAERIIEKLGHWSGNDLSELDKEFGYFSIPEAIAKATTPQQG